MAKLELNVDGMSCSHCENAVINAVSELEGVSKVLVSLSEKKVTVDYDEAGLDEQQIKEIILDLGYDVL